MADRLKRAGKRSITHNMLLMGKHSLSEMQLSTDSMVVSQIPFAAAMLMQASIRRLLVRARKARLIQRREVLRRRRAKAARLSGEVFNMTGSDVMHELHMHNDDAIETTTNQLPPD